MQRVPSDRSDGASAGPRPLRAASAARARSAAPAASGGMRPSGGSMMSDVRLSQIRSDNQRLVVVAHLRVGGAELLLAVERRGEELVGEERIAAVHQLRGLRLDVGELGVGHRGAKPELLRPLERRHAVVGPDALEVGTAVGRARHRPGGGLRRLAVHDGGGREGGAHQEARQETSGHGPSVSELRLRDAYLFRGTFRDTLRRALPAGPAPCGRKRGRAADRPRRAGRRTVARRRPCRADARPRDARRGSGRAWCRLTCRCRRPWAAMPDRSGC